MSEELVPVGALSPALMMAAFLEARGETRGKIAQVVEVDPATISRWRNRDDYRAEVEKWTSREIELVDNMVLRIRSEIASLGVDMVATLRLALMAERSDGSPNWSVRMDAVREIAKLIGVRVLDGEQADGDGSARALAAVTLHIHRGDGRLDISEERMVIEQ